MFYANNLLGGPLRERQKLETHFKAEACLASQFGDSFGVR